MELLSGTLYAKMLCGGAANLNANRKIVNDLNVFPVPDGDTGDNMYMTFASGLNRISENASLSETAQTASSGMLYGARGNSGVILSRIFAGLSKGFDGLKLAGIDQIKNATDEAVRESYAAVSEPAEGTILSVFRDAAEYANSRLTKYSTVRSYLDDFIFEANNSLDRTPELLPVLKKAGVVDSGGAGIVYIAEGMRNAIDGDIAFTDSQNNKKEERTDFSLFTEDSIMKYGYCTEFLLRLQNSKVDFKDFNENEIKKYLESVGDSVVLFRDGSLVKAHVHTMVPGNVLNFCQKYGEFLKLKIENMTLQHSGNAAEQKRLKPKKKYGAVVCACGDGVKDMFTELGADFVVDGGQSSNPSAEDFIEAYRTIDAENIFVLPNNSNIILAAKQSAELYEDAAIHVIETKSVGDGYAAMSSLDLSRDNIEDIFSDAREAMEETVTCYVSKACRDTDMNGISVINGDYIGFKGKTVYSDSPDKNEAAAALLNELGKGKDILIVIYGENTSESEADGLVESVSGILKRTEIIKINGGQPVYDYLFILE